MRTITIQKKLYSFREASSELRDKIREKTFSDAWHFEWSLQERINTLKKYADFIGGKLDYSISCVPDRGEFISITDFDQKLFIQSLNLENCALTGVCYDDDLIELIKKTGCLQDALHCYLKSIHDEYEYTLTNEYLLDLCEANNYEFDENGKLY